MPSSRLVAVITALLYLSGGAGAHAAYNLEQLREIERMIVSKDCGALRRYLNSNPELLVGSDPLAAELRSFASGVDRGLIECLSLRTDSVARSAAIATRQGQQPGIVARQY